MKKLFIGILLASLVAGVWFLVDSPGSPDRTPFKTLSLTFRLPPGYELTHGAPFSMDWQALTPDGKRSAPAKVRSFNPLISPYKFVAPPPPGSVALILNARLYYCDKTTRMCFQDDFETRVPLVPGNDPAISWVWDVIPRKA